jgi:hypothetical protein
MMDLLWHTWRILSKIILIVFNYNIQRTCLAFEISINASLGTTTAWRWPKCHGVESSELVTGTYLWCVFYGVLHSLAQLQTWRIFSIFGHLLACEESD